MRIAYVAHLNDGNGSGVLEKMISQVAYWRSQGNDVTVLVMTRDPDVAWSARLGDVAVMRYEGWASRMKAMHRMMRRIEAPQPDVVYLRYDLFYPSMLWLGRQAGLVVEVNTDDRREYALGSRKRSVYNSLTRGVILRLARACVFVTSELGRSPSFASFRGRREVISNGIDLADYPELPAPAGERPRLAFVGSLGQPWQGTDKVLSLASLRPEWDFDLVGPGATPFAPQCHLAWVARPGGRVGRPGRRRRGNRTPALHRKAMDEACPLKVREYLAVGLPVLYGYSDPDADNLEAHVLRIANTETSVPDALEAITRFVTGARGTGLPVLRSGTSTSAARNGSDWRCSG